MTIRTRIAVVLLGVVGILCVFASAKQNDEVDFVPYVIGMVCLVLCYEITEANSHNNT